MIKLHGAYADEKDQFVANVVGITNGADARAWMAGVSVKLGAGSLLASYNDYNGKNNGATDEERDLRRFGTGYSHPLSRRTNLYVSAAVNDGKKDLENSSSDFKQYTAGVRHLF
jgi:predicted porin